MAGVPNYLGACGGVWVAVCDERAGIKCVVREWAARKLSAEVLRFVNSWGRSTPPTRLIGMDQESDLTSPPCQQQRYGGGRAW